MNRELTGRLRFVEREGKQILQQQWGYKNNWAWSKLHWLDVPLEAETP